MKALKVPTAIAIVLMTIALVLGVYVWYVLQTLELAPVNTEAPSAESSVTETQPALENDSSETVITEPTVIKLETLSDSQRGILETFGYSDDTITITSAMIGCATDAVGTRRLDEIMNGSAPSPLESLKLMPCFKR